MLSGDFEKTITDPATGDEVDVLVEWTGTPGDPGRYTGPMEDSYPAEAPEVEIGSITALEGEKEYEFNKLSDTDRDALNDAAVEAACEADNERAFDEFD